MVRLLRVEREALARHFGRAEDREKVTGSTSDGQRREVEATGGLAALATRNDQQHDSRDQGDAADDGGDGNRLTFLSPCLDRAQIDHGLLFRPRDPAPDQADQADHDQNKAGNARSSHVRFSRMSLPPESAGNRDYGAPDHGGLMPFMR